MWTKSVCGLFLFWRNYNIFHSKETDRQRDRQISRQTREHGLCCSCGLTLFFRDGIGKEVLHFNNRILRWDPKIQWTCSKKSTSQVSKSTRTKYSHSILFGRHITIDERLRVSAQSLVYSVWNIQVGSWDQLFRNYFGSILACWYRPLSEATIPDRNPSCPQCPWF